MSDKEYYINGEWLTWDEVHNLGYTTTPAELITVYDSENNEITLKKDTSNNTYYDETNHRWLSDITELNVYKSLGTITLYTSEVSNSYACYSNSELSDTPTHVEYDSNIVSLDELYTTNGMTQYACSDYTVTDGNILVWYDNVLNKYWDNRQDKKEWLDSPPVIEDIEPSNWTPPSFITVDFNVDFSEYIELEPLKVSGSGNISTANISNVQYDDLKFIDSNTEDYELLVSDDVINNNYVMYTTEAVTFNGTSYPADTLFTLSKCDYYEEIEGSETFYYLIDNVQHSETFYYRTDFENHIGERIYFNESNLPETYDYFYSQGYSRSQFTTDDAYYIIANNEIVHIKLNDDDLIYSDGNWLTVDQYKVDHDVYILEDTEQLYHDNSTWYIDYSITSGKTSGFATNSNYRKLLYTSDNEVFVADTNYIYAWDNTMDTTSFTVYPCVYSISNLSSSIPSDAANRKYLLQVFREDADPLNPLSGTSTNLIAYTATDISISMNWSTIPTVIVNKFSKVV